VTGIGVDAATGAAHARMEISVTVVGHVKTREFEPASLS